MYRKILILKIEWWIYFLNFTRLFLWSLSTICTLTYFVRSCVYSNSEIQIFYEIVCHFFFWQTVGLFPGWKEIRYLKFGNSAWPHDFPVTLKISSGKKTFYYNQHLVCYTSLVFFGYQLWSLKILSFKERVQICGLFIWSFLKIIIGKFGPTSCKTVFTESAITL